MTADSPIPNDLSPILAGLNSKSPTARKHARRALQDWLDEARRRQDGEARRRIDQPQVSYSNNAVTIRIRLTRGTWMDLPDELVVPVYEEVAAALRGLADSFDAMDFEQ